MTDVRPRLHAIESGGGQIQRDGDVVRLFRPRATASAYVNAELADAEHLSSIISAVKRVDGVFDAYRMVPN